LKKLKAQQITEFMLAAPLLILFFVVLTEFAFAFNSNLVFSNAVKSSSLSYLSTITYETSKEDFESAINNYIKDDMQKNKLPNLDSLEASVITTDGHPTVVASYTYKPDFNFAYLPALKQIHMTEATVFPFTIPDLSGYQNGLTTEELNLIKPSSAPGGDEDGDGDVDGGEDGDGGGEDGGVE